MKSWRFQGLRTVIYLDGGIAAVKGKLEAAKATMTIQQDLARVGFVVNVAKCKWTPSQKCTWLGFDFDLHLGRISVPQQKIDALKIQLEQAAQKPRLQVRASASLTGIIIAMSMAFGPIARLMTRGLYALLNT